MHHIGARRYLIQACFAATLVSTSSTATANWCEGKVSDTEPRVVERLSKPRPLQSYIDPAFGTQVTRITDAPNGTVRRTLYNTVQPWNADESLLVLYHSGDANAGHHLYDGKTYEYLRPLGIAPGDIEGIYWDPNDAYGMFFVQRRPKGDSMVGNLVKYNVLSQTRTQVANLNNVCGAPDTRNEIYATGGVDIQGMAGNLIGLRCQNNIASGESSDLTFTVNVRTGDISPRMLISPFKPQGANSSGFSPILSATPFPSGDRVLIQNTVYDSNMNYLYRLDSVFGQYVASDGRTYQIPKPEHSTIGKMPNGNDAFFTPQYEPTEFGCNADSDFGRGAIVAYDIPARRCDVIVGRSTGWGYPLRGVHLSAVSAGNPGWVSMTSIGYGQFEYFNNRRPAPVFFSELSLSHANSENPITCRLAHTRTYGKKARNAAPYKTAYFGEPHAVMSPSGSRILFNSDWYDSGSVDTYAVTLRQNDSDNQIATNTPAPAPEAIDRLAPPPPAPEASEPATEELVAAQPGESNASAGFVFSRTDKEELRWITTNRRGNTGSIWISEACAATLGGVSQRGDWRNLMSIAPDIDSVENPCAPDFSLAPEGYVYSRTDREEFRWITTADSGEYGSVWISASCAQLLGGVSERGDWFDLMAVAPAFDRVVSPCQ